MFQILLKTAHSQMLYCKKTDILLIDELLDLELLKISHRYVNETLPKPVETLPKPVANLFQANDYNHMYLTRARNNPRIERHQSKIFHDSFLCRGPSIWSNLRGYLGVRDALFQYLWKHSISEVMCLESP